VSNIAEGFERDSPAEFQQFLKIAKGSCGETRSLLYVALDNELIDQPTFDQLRGHAEEVTRVVAGLRTSVARQRIRAAQERKRR
jgi:four helix bundle protein